MTTTPSGKRISLDVSDLVDQLRPYTPQANRNAFRQPPLNSFDANTPTHVFSSPLPPPNNRGKPTADEAARVLLADDPFLNLRSPPVHHSHHQLESHVINIQVPPVPNENDQQRDRVSASFRVRPPTAAMAFSPVLPRPISETLPPTQPLSSNSPSSSSYPLTTSSDRTPTPVSAAKPPRPPVPRLQQLHSPPRQHAYHSPPPSTPFAGTIPLSYSAVKTPGAPTLDYLGETPASARQNHDPSSMVEFFRSRSAHVTSPIFSTRKKLDCEDLGSPELRINPLADSSEDIRAIPKGVRPEVVVRMDFSLSYGFDRAEDVDLSSRANRVPVLYAVVVRTTDLDGDIRPAFARLERDGDSAHTMLVEVVRGIVMFAPVVDSHESTDSDHDDGVLEAVMTFWAAPDSFVQFGSATLLLTVVDKDDMSHETKIELHVVGTEPVIAVQARENHPEPERKETTLTFESSKNPAEENITIWNQTFGGAPIFLNALVTDSASGAFTIRDQDGKVNDCIPMMIPGGKSYTFTACFEILPNVTLRGRYYGCVLLKLATLMPSRGRHTSSDIDLHQFYDHVLNFEARIPGVSAIDRLSTLEDPSSNNIEEMLYEHRYGNDYDMDRDQRFDHPPGFDNQDGNGTSQEHQHVTAANGVLKRLSLVVSPEAIEPVPDGFQNQPYMVCEYSLAEPPRWIDEESQFDEQGYEHEQLESVDTEVNDRRNQSEDAKRLDRKTPEALGQNEASPNLQNIQESYEEWKKSLEEVDTAFNAKDEGNQDLEMHLDHNTSRVDIVPEEGKRVSDNDENMEASLEKLNGLACGHEITESDKLVNTDPDREEAERYLTQDQKEGIVAPDSLNSTQFANPEADQDGLDSMQLRPPASHDLSHEKDDEINLSVSQLGNMNPRLSATSESDANIKPSSNANIAAQGPSLTEPKAPEKTRINQEKPPLPTKMTGRTGFGQTFTLPKGDTTVIPDRYSIRKEGTYLVEDPVEGAHRKNRTNLKGIIGTVGAAVDGLRGEHGFLKQYTKFDSTFNMSEDLSVRGSRPVSVSSAGSMATISQPQRSGIRNLASKWGTKKNDEVRYRPKLRIPRKLLEKGLSIAADSGSAKLTVCNGSLATIRVDISAKQGLKLKGQILIQPQFLALRPEQKAVIRLTRLTSEESKAYVVLVCSNLNDPQTNSCTYRLPVVIEAAKNRVPIVQGFAVDRPTLTFYNPKSSARHCRVRVLNGTRRKVGYKVWIGKNKEHSAYHESAFSILSHHEGTVEPQKCFSIIVVFDALGQTEYFHEKLFISVGRKTDHIPMFGYGGASNIKFSRSARGLLRAHNSGCRYGFLILSGPEVDSPENDMTRVVLAPEETRDLVAPYGSGTIIFSGDEIARTRFCRSHQLLEAESDEKDDESSLFLGHFDGQEQAAEDERLFWNEENKHILHYAGRLVDSTTRRFMFDTYSGKVVPYVERGRDGDTSWHACLDGSRFIHIENYDSKHDLAFSAVGAEPNAGSIPPLGDAILAAFAETVQIYARGQCQELVSQSLE